MIRTLLWKEYREQRATALALILFAVALPIVVQLFIEPANAADSPFSHMAIAIVWLTGLVVGGQAFAGEQEGGTQAWLDSQPAWRRSIGRTKIAFSLAVVLLIAAALCVLAAFTAWARPASAAELLAVLLVAGMFGLGCGLLGSTIGKSTLTAIGWGIAVQFIVGSVWTAFPLLGWPIEWALLSAVLVTLPMPFVAALRRFHSLDRARRQSSRTDAASHSSWRSLLWLVWRQCRMSVAIIAAAGLAVAIFVPISRDWPIWPAIGTAFGIVAGIAAFSPERSGDSQRLLGDRRWPISRVWLVKIAFCLILALIPVLMQLAVIGARLMILSFDLATSAARTQFEQYTWPFVRTDFLLLGPLYGFAVGQFLGMICRKGAVAFVLSAIVGTFMVAAWWPSTVIGGLHLWQWIVPPLLLIAATRWLAWPWATARLAEPRSALRAAGVSALATVLTVGGVAYRVIEVPDRAAPFDVAAFEASLPTPEQNQAIIKLTQVLRQFRAEQYDTATFLVVRDDGVEQFHWMLRAAQFASMQTWLKEDVELNRKLDEFAALPYIDNLRAALALPFGMAEFADGVVGVSDHRLMAAAASLGNLVVARSLQLASRGHAAEAFDALFVAFDLGRHLQSRADFPEFFAGSSIEQNALLVFNKLAESSGVTPEILRGALARLVASDRASPPATETLRIAYLSALRSVRRGGISPKAAEGERWTPRRLAALAPWETERSVHILNAMVAGFLRTASLSYPDAMQRIGNAPDPNPQLGIWLAAWTSEKSDSIAPLRQLQNWISNSIWNYAGHRESQVLIHDQFMRTNRRAAILQLALATDQLENREPARDLSELAPRLLTEIPLDPYSMKPFRYRVSTGEKIKLYPHHHDPEQAAVIVPIGGGIIWSVGGDMQDDGGVVSGASWWGLTRYRPGRDLIFLAPLIKKP